MARRAQTIRRLAAALVMAAAAMLLASVPASAQLQFSKSFTNDPVNPGDTVTLEFMITNNSGVNVSAITFTDDLNAALAGLAATGLPANNICGAGSQITGTTNLSFTGGELANGASCTFSVTLQVPASATPGTFTNTTSQIQGFGQDETEPTGPPASDDLEVVAPPVGVASLRLAKSFTDDPVQSGDTVTLEFTVTNTDANNAASNISFTDDLDAVIPGLAAAGLPAGNVCGAGSQIGGTTLLTLTGASLAAGASCTFSLTLRVPANTAPGAYLNTTSVITGIINATNVTGPAASDTLDISGTVQRTSEVIENFLSNRANLIVGEDPLLTSHLNGNGNQNNNPVNVTALERPGGTQVAFSTSLSRMARASVREAGGKTPFPGAMALGHAKGTGPGERHPFDVWVRGVFTKYEDSAGAGNRDGDFGLLYLGGEYEVRPGLLVGVIVQFDWTDEENDRTGAGADGEGWMAGPYIVGKLAPNVYYQARAAWGQSDNDVTPLGTYSDSFDTDRWLVSSKIEGRFQRGPWRVSPIGSIIYFEDEQKRYTDTLGNAIPGQTVSLGRLSFGPQIAYTVRRHGEDYVELFGEATGIWDFDHENRTVNGLAVGTDEVRARLTGGVVLRGDEGLRFEVEGFYDGIGASNFEAYGGTARLRFPLN